MENALNCPKIPKKWAEQVAVGLKEISPYFRKKGWLLALDGFIGVDWQKIISKLGVASIDIDFCRKPANEIEKIVKPYLTDDPVFGKVFQGKLEDFFDQEKLKELRRKLKGYKKQKRAIICFGSGAAISLLRDLYDHIFYIDVTREEAVKRIKEGRRKDLLPAYLSTKRLYYIDYPVLDKHRKELLPHLDYYLDGSVKEKPKLIPRAVLDGILSGVSQYPFRLKPCYDPGPWGGQWLKKIRNLPESMVNCAWSYDLIAPEMSFKAALGNTFLEIPFLTLMAKNPQKIMGKEAVKRFGDYFPIRFNYDESMDGGDMAIQVHPDDAYIKKHFNEPFRQDESYYIVDTGPGSRTYLGLKEGVDQKELYRRVREAEMKGIPFDHSKYINSVASEPGDLFLIPAGTIHASGKNQVVMEISATTYRYTFHLYDYLRPGLDGKLRPIHSQHAFNVIKFNRRTEWAAKNLKQKPRLIRKGKGWVEYLLGKRKDMFFETCRLEFKKSIEDNTKDKFHILALVEGEKILIQSHRYPERNFELNFSEVVIVPACFGKYSVINLGLRSCKVIKTFLS